MDRLADLQTPGIQLLIYNFPVLGLKLVPPSPAFYVGSGDLSSDPHDCTTITLLAESFPKVLLCSLQVKYFN